MRPNQNIPELDCRCAGDNQAGLCTGAETTVLWVCSPWPSLSGGHKDKLLLDTCFHPVVASRVTCKGRRAMQLAWKCVPSRRKMIKSQSRWAGWALATRKGGPLSWLRHPWKPRHLPGQPVALQPRPAAAAVAAAAELCERARVTFALYIHVYNRSQMAKGWNHPLNTAPSRAQHVPRTRAWGMGCGPPSL